MIRDLHQQRWAAIDSNIQYPFGVYLDCFVLYLILRFTSRRDDKTDDKVLDKEVPSIVFVKNQQVIKDVFKQECKTIEEKKKEARLQCQTNLYMHYLLKEEGIDDSNELDVGIGISFCNLKKMRESAMILDIRQSFDDDGLSDNRINLTSSVLKETDEQVVSSEEQIISSPQSRSSILMAQEVEKFWKAQGSED